ncbi:DUF3040 domain-containing protein [Streptomyces sp. NPDC053431]|uniref:DUF3040 domain-containing protein n=1 Tax=Streptomyces sp. NPDC053431 TaxID=3365703 RepID=UPI0037D3DBAF
MDGAQLSPRERRILAEIEHELGEDPVFARTLTSGRRPRFPSRWRASRNVARPPRTGRLLRATTFLLGPVAIALFVIAVVTESPVLIWAFALAWVLTLVCLLRLVLRWSRRHLVGDERPRPDHGGLS